MDPNLSNSNNPVTPTANVVVPPPVPPIVPLAEPVVPPLPQTPSVSLPVFQGETLAPPPDTNFDGLPKKHIISKKVAAIALVLFLAVSIPLTVFVANQQQNIKSSATPPVTGDTIVAVFNGENITRDKVLAVAEEIYATNAIDNQALQDALDTLLERRILDKEKTDKNIAVSDEEIQAKVENDGLSNNEATYAILREKVTQLNTRNWQVYTIGFWVPANDDLAELSSEEKTQREQILSTGKSMLNQAKTRLENGELAVDVAESLLSQNPNFQGVLAVNGMQLVSGSQPPEELQNPKTYNYEIAYVGESFYDAVYSMSVDGEVKLSISADGSGGEVIQLASSNKAPFNTYEDWLSDRRSTAVINGL